MCLRIEDERLTICVYCEPIRYLEPRRNYWRWRVSSDASARFRPSIFSLYLPRTCLILHSRDQHLLLAKRFIEFFNGLFLESQRDSGLFTRAFYKLFNSGTFAVSSFLNPFQAWAMPQKLPDITHGSFHQRLHHTLPRGEGGIAQWLSIDEKFVFHLGIPHAHLAWWRTCRNIPPSSEKRTLGDPRLSRPALQLRLRFTRFWIPNHRLVTAIGSESQFSIRCSATRTTLCSCSKVRNTKPDSIIPKVSFVVVTTR